MTHLPPELARDDLGETLVEGLRRAYEANQEAFQADAGHNALTFGICVWQSGVHFVDQSLGALDGVSTTVASQSLDIRVGRCKLRVHKLGDSEFDDARTSFPHNVGPAARMGRYEQLEFELVAEARREGEYLDWVVGHYGNAIDGLRAVRLQAVGDDRALDGTISGWGDIVTLFDVATGTLVQMVPANTTHEVVVIPEPDVALQSDADEEESDLRQS